MQFFPATLMTAIDTPTYYILLESHFVAKFCKSWRIKIHGAKRPALSFIEVTAVHVYMLKIFHTHYTSHIDDPLP